jgi:uncharacterized integral membrane protein
MTDVTEIDARSLQRRPGSDHTGQWSFANSRILLVGLIAFLIALNVALAKCNLLGDPDTHWHVAVGRWIFEHRDWPRVEVFSHTFAGQPWIAKEWLSQVVMNGAFGLAGWTGVALLGAMCIAASIAMVSARLARGLSGIAVATFIVFAFLMSSASLLSRPHVVALPLMVIWTLGILAAVERRGVPHWLLIPVMLLWANAHPGYTIGFLIAGVLAVEAVRDTEKSRRAGMAGQWALFLGMAFAASFITPYGHEVLTVTQKMLAGAGREGIAYIDEWRPIELDLAGITGLIMLAALLLGLALQPGRNAVRIALVLILGAMMIRHVRFELLFAFTALPIAMSAIAAGPLGRWIAPPPTGSKVRAGLVVLVSAVALTSAAALATKVEINPEHTPAHAVEAARRLDLTKLKVYNSYNLGGYLIEQRIPTFIDGRTDQLFLNGFFDTYMRTRDSANKAELREWLKALGVGWAIVATGSPEAEALTSLGWHSRHKDAVAIVLTPPAD